MLTSSQRETMRRNGRASAAKRKSAGFYSSEHQSRRRKNQIAAEEQQAEELRALGFEVFSPTVVCDRIAVKDGQVFFVEFKKPGQELRPGQKRIAELVPQMYIVRVS